MSEERTNRQNFFSRMFGEQHDEHEGNPILEREEIGAGHRQEDQAGLHSRAFTVERAAEVIKNLPPEVPRPAAVRIVRQTLEAAGIDINELDASTRSREAKLESEIDLSEERIRKLKEDTEEVIRDLEDQIRKAREARNAGVAEQERNIEAAETGLEDIDRVRGFFGLSQEGPPAEETTAGDDTRTIRPPEDDTRVIPPAEDDTRVIGGAGEDDTQVLRKPGPLSDSNEYWDTEDDREK